VNVFELPAELPSDELSERLAGGREVLVERIVSTGQATPSGEWLEQDKDEWVVLLQGEAQLSYADGWRVELRAGDHVLIPAGTRHRVERTSAEPACIWIAVHSAGLAG
jgi:cupin 2 domain-containing protein